MRLIRQLENNITINLMRSKINVYFSLLWLWTRTSGRLVWGRN